MNLKNCISSFILLLFVHSLASTAWGSVFYNEHFLTQWPKLSQLTDEELSARIINHYTGTSDCSNLSQEECSRKIDLADLKGEVRQFVHQYKEYMLDSQGIPIKYLSAKVISDSGMFTNFTKVKIPSLKQRPGNHSSNQIHALYFSSDHKGCYAQVPTMMLIHHAVDDMQPLIRLVDALYAFGGNFNIMLLYLPHFGPRRHGRSQEFLQREWDSIDEVNKDFFPSELDKVVENIQQSFLDISVAKSWLEHQKYVDPDQISIGGFSLGGIVAASYVGLHPRSFNSVFTLVTGGDLASMSFNNFRTYPDPQRVQEIQDLHVTESKMRRALLAIDPNIWAGSVEVQKWDMVNASNDELIDQQNGYLKLMKELQDRTQLEVNWMDTLHDPGSAGLLSQFSNVLVPLLKFISPVGRKQQVPRCKKFE